jgi:hypothetical protein
MRVQLRALQCPLGIVNQIGERATAGARKAYGRRYEVDVVHR